MRSFIGKKTILCMLVFFTSSSFYLKGQMFEDHVSIEQNMLSVCGKISEARLQQPSAEVLRTVRQQLENMKAKQRVMDAPAYTSDLGTSRVMLAGYAIHIIGSSSCTLPTANNVFGFDVSDLCKQTTYPSPFTSAGYGSGDRTMSVYCGDWIGDKWLVFTTIKQAGQLSLGYWMTFDPITYDADIIGVANGYMQCQDMAYDVTTSKMYGVGLEQELCQFNTTDTESKLIGTVRKDGEPFEKRFMALACNSEGTLFAINVNKNLYRIDKNTGAATLVGSLKLDSRIISPDNLQSATFDRRTNTMYFALRGTAYHELYTINTTTGEASLIGNMYVETAGLFHHYYTSKDVPPEMVTDFKATTGENPLEIKLTWRNPERNFNGAALADLDSLYIYRGLSGYALSLFDRIKAAGTGEVMSYDVTENAVGTYYYGCMSVTKGGKRSLLAGGAAYCFESKTPYKMGFEKEDNYMPLTIPAGWRVDTLTAKYKNSGMGAIVTTSTAGNKILINGLKAEKGAVYQLNLCGLAPSLSGARFNVDFCDRKNYNPGTIPRQTSPFTQLTVTGIAQNDVLPVAIQCAYNGIYLDDISIKMLYPGTTPDSVRAPKVVIAEKGKLEAKVSWINPTLDAGGNPLKALTGIIIQKTFTGGAFTTGVTADTIPATELGKMMSATIAIPTSNNYYFRIIPINADGPSPYYYDLGKVGFIGRDTVPIAPQVVEAIPILGNKANIKWDEVTLGRNGGYLDGIISGYEVRITTYDTKVLLNNIFVASETEYTTDILPDGIYCIGVKAIRNNDLNNVGLEALAYVTVGARQNQKVIFGDFSKKPDSNTHPLHIAYGSKSAVSQSIFTKEEIGGKCVIDTLELYLYAPNVKNEFKQEIIIYLGYRKSDEFVNASDWNTLNDDETQMVFSDSIRIPVNQQVIKIPIKPFYYDGDRNLLLTSVKKDLVAPPNNFSCSFVGINGDINRSITKRTTTAIDHLDDINIEIVGTGELMKYSPTLLINRMENLATVKGFITDKITKMPIENVKLLFTPKEGQVKVLKTYIVNDSVTGKYDFAYLPAGTYTLILSKLGYKEYTTDITVSMGETYSQDFTLEASTNLLLKGKVVNLKNEPLSDVKVKAEGLISYEAMTQTDGTFMISEILSDNTYKMSFSKADYVTTTFSWTLEAKDTVFVPVAMPYVSYPVSNVDATTTREVATIKIGKPAIMKEAAWATDTIAKKVGGSREKMIAAIQFYPSDIQNLELGNKELIMVKFYASDSTANYVVHIYEHECGTLIYSQNIGNSLIGWQDVILKTRYIVDPQKEFGIGVEALPGYMGAPFALDLGPKTFKGDKVWFDGQWTRISKLITTYNNNWQIKGVFGQELSENAAGGYQLYRLTDKDVKNLDKWVKITGASIPSITDGYKDYTWENLETGAYKYAVKADWMDGNLSDVTFSNNVYRGMDSDIKVRINTNGASKKGATVSLTNKDGLASHFYEKVSDNSGLVEFPGVWNGNYALDIVLAGHSSVRENIVIQEDATIEGGQMTEYISNPELLSSVVDSDSVKISWTMKYPANWFDDFESYEDFAISNYGDYILDGKEPKYTMTGSSWINNQLEQSFIVFNPYTTTPPVQSYKYTPHSGSKELVAFSSVSKQNKDFIVRAVLQGGGEFSFYAKGIGYSGVSEKFNVMYSSTDAKMSSFVMLSDSTLWAASEWTKYSFPVPENAKYMALNCVSQDLQAFLVDDMRHTAVNEGIPLSYNVFADNKKIDVTIDADATSYVFKGLSGGKHVLGLKALYASGTSDLVTVTITLSDIQNTEAAHVRLYPNPSLNGIFYVTASNDYDVEVLSFDGKVIKRTELNNGKVRIDLSAQPKGYYMIRLTNENESIILKAAK